MRFNQLGHTQIKVSAICLGTMTFGEQNSESEAHAQMDVAFEHGVNFFDTAEMYSIPPKAETQGLTETYIGNWLSKKANRDQIVIATKVSGPASWMSHLRGGPCLNQDHIRAAVQGSLKRLKTSYIDVYQVHWPERQTNFFGKLGYSHQPESDGIEIEETLGVLSELVKEGLIRHVGISNETPWGLMRYLDSAKENQHARIVSIQNPYSLLNRSFEVGLAEMACREHVGLLAYSPLAFGVLTGKYLDGNHPANSRLTLFKDYQRYSKPQVEAITRQYVGLARQNNMTPAQLALAFVNSRDFVTSNIIGATTLGQLKENLSSIDIQLDVSVVEDINRIHNDCPNIAP
ncbi:MAG: NADP(H)-dependent aldo-keto reductase [Gammaproteobacteria bacterium]|nr:NADP(H)-dependent aldo-keto reductase [Gammaproteobacteria bacterium]